MHPFEASRPDGRSDRQVLYDLTSETAPDTTFTYPQLADALAEGLDETPDRPRIYRAVAAANKTLLRERSRYLSVVKGIGYRMLTTGEHLPAALVRKDKAQTHLQRGIELLRNARLDELNAAQRTLHEGQLMILSGIYHAVQDSMRRHDRTEAIIADLRKESQRIEERLERLEHDTND